MLHSFGHEVHLTTVLGLTQYSILYIFYWTLVIVITFEVMTPDWSMMNTSCCWIPWMFRVWMCYLLCTAAGLGLRVSMKQLTPSTLPSTRQPLPPDSENSGEVSDVPAQNPGMIKLHVCVYCEVNCRNLQVNVSWNDRQSFFRFTGLAGDCERFRIAGTVFFAYCLPCLTSNQLQILLSGQILQEN